MKTIILASSLIVVVLSVLMLRSSKQFQRERQEWIDEKQKLEELVAWYQASPTPTPVNRFISRDHQYFWTGYLTTDTQFLAFTGGRSVTLYLKTSKPDTWVQIYEQEDPQFEVDGNIYLVMPFRYKGNDEWIEKDLDSRVFLINRETQKLEIVIDEEAIPTSHRELFKQDDQYTPNFFLYPPDPARAVLSPNRRYLPIQIAQCDGCEAPTYLFVYDLQLKRLWFAGQINGYDFRWVSDNVIRWRQIRWRDPTTEEGKECGLVCVEDLGFRTFTVPD